MAPSADLLALSITSGAHVALIDILEGVDDVEYAPVKRLADSKSLSLTYRACGARTGART